MSTLKIASFNIEWMVSIFNGDWNQWDETIHSSFPGKNLGGIKLAPINDIPDLCKRIAGTIKEMDPDILGIQEGPPRKEQLELFVKDYLDEKYTVFTSNSRWQTIHALVKNSISDKVKREDPNEEEIKKLWLDIPFQPWGTIEREERKLHDCYRRPLMLQFSPDENKTLEILVLHTKSKFSKLKTQQQWEEREADAVFDALLSRQKLSAEIYRLRAYLEQRLNEQNEDDCIMVMGDFNDGPLAEDLEKEFLIHNILDEIVGSVVKPKIVLSHAMSEDVLINSSSTEFHNPMKNGEKTQELIDHIFISPGFRLDSSDFKLVKDSCEIEDGAFEANFDIGNGDEDRQLRPSDHRPISVKITY